MAAERGAVVGGEVVGVGESADVTGLGQDAPGK